MRRVAAFVVLLLICVLWTFPHRRVVEHMLARRLRGLDVDVTMRSVAPSLRPFGYRLDDVQLHGRGYSLGIQSLGLQIGSGSPFRANVCGGSLEGRVEEAASEDGEGRLTVHFEHIDPSACFELGSIDLSGSFDGDARLEGLGKGAAGAVLGRAARAGALEIVGVNGVLSGTLPKGPADAETAAAQPIGSWEFARASLRAHIDGTDVIVDGASADAEGLSWDVSRGRLTPGMASRTRINVDLRARRIADTPRANAMIGLLPRATEDRDGWRRYRITGTLDAPRLLGLK